MEVEYVGVVDFTLLKFCLLASFLIHSTPFNFDQYVPSDMFGADGNVLSQTQALQPRQFGQSMLVLPRPRQFPFIDNGNTCSESWRTCDTPVPTAHPSRIFNDHDDVMEKLIPHQTQTVFQGYEFAPPLFRAHNPALVDPPTPTRIRPTSKKAVAFAHPTSKTPGAPVPLQNVRSPVTKGNVHKRKTSTTLNKTQAAAHYAAIRHQKLSALLLGAKGLPPVPVQETPSPVLSATSTLHSSPRSAPSEASTAVADCPIDEAPVDIKPTGKSPAGNVGVPFRC